MENLKNLTDLILSKDASYETRAASQGAMLLDQKVNIWRVAYEDLEKYTNLLDSDTTLAVGSVEYLQKALKMANKQIPCFVSYPKSLQKFLHRNIQLMSKEEFIRQDFKHVFIKPYKTKLFTGFCYKKNKEYTDEQDKKEHSAFELLESNTMIWVSELIKIEQEWRCYIKDEKLLGYARYDEQDSEDFIDLSVIGDMIKEAKIMHPYTIDIGVYNSKTILIEVNDAWAIGLYAGAMNTKEYLKYLYERWLTIPNKE